MSKNQEWGKDQDAIFKVLVLHDFSWLEFHLLELHKMIGTKTAYQLIEAELVKIRAFVDERRLLYEHKKGS